MPVTESQLYQKYQRIEILVEWAGSSLAHSAFMQRLIGLDDLLLLELKGNWKKKISRQNPPSVLQAALCCDVGKVLK